MSYHKNMFTSEKKFAAKETLAAEPERESEGELCAEI